MKNHIKLHLPILIFSLCYIVLAIVLNIQFIEGSNVNNIIAGHDEYIAVKEVYSIIQPESFKHFVMAVISGDALYYGRLMFYADALVAYLPFLIWGVKGMVLSIRLTHSIVLLISLVLLSRTFIKGNFEKILFLIGSTCIYYTMYFMMMPKPEPMQLLALTLFLILAHKKNWSFGAHYFFLGLAYGLKFNVILILPMLLFIPFFVDNRIRFSNSWKSFMKSFLWMLSGVCIAVPCLLLSFIKPVFLKTYLHETYGGTGKLYDDPNIGISNWLENGLGGSFLGVNHLGYPFVVFILIITALSVISYLKNPERNKLTSLLILISGILLMAAIMLKTKRLWPHYIWTSYVLLLLGTFMELNEKVNVLGKVLKGTIGLFILVSFGFFLYRELPLFLNMSKSNSVTYNINHSHKVIDYIKTRYKGSRIGTDGSILYPFEDFVGVNIYHPFQGASKDRVITRFYWYFDFPDKIWEDSNDIVVFYKRHPVKLSNASNGNYLKLNSNLLELYKQKTQSDFVKDTAFGEIIVYKRNVR